MQLEYINENLNKLIENINNLLYLKPYDIGNKRALFAIIKEEAGIYKKIQITKEQSKLTFPWEPLTSFFKGPGSPYLNNFIILNQNNLALNTINLDGFIYKTLENKIFNIGILATFNDGSATFVMRENSLKFDKQGGIQAYIKLLKNYKEYEPKYDTYEIIEHYGINNDTFIIPKLQKEDQPQIKKLIPKQK